MSDVEEDLRAARLAAPSAELDRRIDEAFGAAGARRRTGNLRRMGWLGLLAALAGAAAILFVSLQGRRPPARIVTYRFAAQGQLRDFLLGPPGGMMPPPHYLIRPERPETAPR